MLLFILLFCLNIIYGQQYEYKIGYSTVNQYDKVYPYSSNITNSFNSGHNSGPRKIIVYYEDGTTEDTGNGKRGNPTSGMWESGYNYYWDGTSWWKTDGITWWKWESGLGFGILGWGWKTHSWFGEEHKPNENAINHVYQENPQPLGDPPYLFLYCLSIYVIYERTNRYRRKRRVWKIDKDEVLDYGLNTTY